MRTTLDIDADVLEAAKEISRRTRRTAGEVISSLARQALSSTGPGPRRDPSVSNGFEVVPAADRVVTSELVQKLLEESEAP